MKKAIVSWMLCAALLVSGFSGMSILSVTAQEMSVSNAAYDTPYYFEYDAYAFSGCGDELTLSRYYGGAADLVVPEMVNGCTVTAIGNIAFQYCNTLENVTLPATVKSIGNEAFAYCSRLKSITIPEGVVSIGDGAFLYCEELQSVTLPDSLISIGYEAFCNCFSLSEFTIPKNVISIGNYALPTNLEKYTVADGNTAYCTIDDVLFTADKTTLVQYPQLHARTEYSVPAGVRTIGAGAFGGSSLTKIILPEGLENILFAAFSGNFYLTSIYIPASVTYVEDRLFDWCDSLYEVFYGGTKKQWNTVFGYNFNYVHYNVTDDEHFRLLEVAEPPMCVWPGWAIYTCDCGYEKGMEMEPTGHSGTVLQTIDPTCDAIGYTLYRCGICSEEYEDDYTDLLGHTFVNNVCINCHKAVADCLASPHKYENNCDQTWVVSQPDALSISLTFSAETETDEDYDYIYLYDANDNLIGAYTGTQLASQTVKVQGELVKIRFVSDKSMTYYGFAVTSVMVEIADTSSVRGDVNGDGDITLSDAMQAFYAVNEKINLTNEATMLADVNGDGELTLADAMKIFYFINEKIASL